jgi:hypothetical protein
MEEPMKTIIFAAAAASFIAAPAHANFWIVRNSPISECKIIGTKPADTKVTVVGNKLYKTRDEASKAMAIRCKK